MRERVYPIPNDLTMQTDDCALCAVDSCGTIKGTENLGLLVKLTSCDPDSPGEGKVLLVLDRDNALSLERQLKIVLRMNHRDN